MTAKRNLSKGLQLNTSYAWSKSLDYNSQFLQGVVVQDSRNLRNDYGRSDFDAAHHFSVSGIYALPFHGNRLKDGWQMSLIETAQTGQPLNFHISTTTLTNGLTTVRPNVSGPIMAGCSKASLRTPCRQRADWLHPEPVRSSLIRAPAGFGSLGRNVVSESRIPGCGFHVDPRTLVSASSVRATWLAASFSRRVRHLQSRKLRESELDGSGCRSIRPSDESTTFGP